MLKTNKCNLLFTMEISVYSQLHGWSESCTQCAQICRYYWGNLGAGFQQRRRGPRTLWPRGEEVGNISSHHPLEETGIVKDLNVMDISIVALINTVLSYLVLYTCVMIFICSSQGHLRRCGRCRHWLAHPGSFTISGPLRRLHSTRLVVHSGSVRQPVPLLHMRFP